MLDRRELLESALVMAGVPLLTRAANAVPVASPQADMPYKGLVELTRLLHKKELSPVEVAEAQLARIAMLDPVLHSYVRLTGDLALEQARMAEKRILAGEIRGPLDGAPVGVKDIIWTRDAVTAAGSGLYANYLPPANATCVDRLFRAGAVLLGKLTTTEFAGATYDPGIPVPINPWNRSLWAGASSSGPGVATAAGLCYGALGTDTGGSIRFPAAMDGIVGFKPTWSRISTHGIFYGVPSMDHVGPMARKVEDVSAMFQALSGSDRRDPRTSNRWQQPYTLARQKDLHGLKVGLDANFGLNDADPSMRVVMDAAIATLRGLGATLVTVRFPDRTELFETVLTIAAKESIDYKNPVAAAAAAPDPAQYQHAVAWRGSLSREVADLLDRIDVLVTPVVPSALMRVEGMDKLESDQELFRKTLRYVVPFDLTGSPALVLPAGVNQAGGPVAIQFVAQRFREDVLLQVGYAFEQATQWHLRRPQLEPALATSRYGDPQVKGSGRAATSGYVT
jgi:amidase